jgi:outer membrane protein
MRLSRLAALLLLLSTTLGATAASAGTFEQLFRAAQEHDAVYAAARAQYQADSEHRAIGRASLYPSLSLSALVSHNTNSRSDIATPQTTNKYDYDNQSVSFRLTQPLYDLERWSLWQQGDTRSKLAEITWAEAQQDLAIRYAQAYFEYLLARDSLELAHAQKTAIAAQKVQTENLFKGGSATITDIEETKARLQLAESGELASANAVETRRRELERLVGKLPANLASAGVFNATGPDPADLETWISQARARNYTVNSQRLADEIAGQQIQRARAGHYPSAALVVNAQAANEPNYFTHQDSSSSIGVQVNIPLYEGGRISAQTRQAQAARERSRYELENALRDAEVKASQHYLDIKNGIAQIQAQEAARRSSEIALDGMKTGQKVGMRTNTDVLNAQQQLYDVRRNLQKERYSYLINRMRLQSVVGSLGVEEITQVDKLLAQ